MDYSKIKKILNSLRTRSAIELEKNLAQANAAKPSVFKSEQHEIEYGTYDLDGEEVITVKCIEDGKEIILWSSDMGSESLLRAVSSNIINGNELSVLEKFWVVAIDRMVDFGDGGLQIGYLRNGKDKVIADISVIKNWVGKQNSVDVSNTITNHGRTITRNPYPILPSDMHYLLVNAIKTATLDLSVAHMCEDDVDIEKVLTKSILKSISNSIKGVSDEEPREGGANEIMEDIYQLAMDKVKIYKNWSLEDAKASIYDYLSEALSIVVYTPCQYIQSGKIEYTGIITHTDRETGETIQTNFNSLRNVGWNKYSYSDYTKEEYELIVNLLAVKSYLSSI